MNRHSISRAFVVLTLLGLTACTTTRTVQDNVQSHYPGILITSVNKTPIDDLYEVIAGDTVFYSNKAGDHLVFGSLFDVNGQEDITANKRLALQQTAKHIDWDSLPKQSAIRWGVAGGQRVAVFTDAHCPYCRSLQTELKQLDKLQIETYLLPHLSGDRIDETTVAIWCHQQPATALDDIMNHKPISVDTRCDTSPLYAIDAFAKSQHFYTTPILIRADGAVHQGALSAQKLTAWLAEVAYE